MRNDPLEEGHRWLRQAEEDLRRAHHQKAAQDAVALAEEVVETVRRHLKPPAS